MFVSIGILWLFSAVERKNFAQNGRINFCLQSISRIHKTLSKSFSAETDEFGWKVVKHLRNAFFPSGASQSS
jgi:hypothetical protein